MLRSGSRRRPVAEVDPLSGDQTDITTQRSALLRLWVSVEAAADFAALDAFGLRRVVLAAEAAFADVSFLLFVCESGDPAADFAAFDAVFDRNVLEAFDAVDFPVRSVFRGIVTSVLYPMNLMCVGEQIKHNQIH